jgi:pyruvate/2-oxoglutarate dehydrogenase complex dihydrolipoamide acyltransferase (E2) component
MAARAQVKEADEEMMAFNKGLEAKIKEKFPNSRPDWLMVCSAPAVAALQAKLEVESTMIIGGKPLDGMPPEQIKEIKTNLGIDLSKVDRKCASIIKIEHKPQAKIEPLAIIKLKKARSPKAQKAEQAKAEALAKALPPEPPQAPQVALLGPVGPLPCPEGQEAPQRRPSLSSAQRRAREAGQQVRQAHAIVAHTLNFVGDAWEVMLFGLGSMGKDGTAKYQLQSVSKFPSEASANAFLSAAWGV